MANTKPPSTNNAEAKLRALLNASRSGNNASLTKAASNFKGAVKEYDSAMGNYQNALKKMAVAPTVVNSHALAKKSVLLAAARNKASTAFKKLQSIFKRTKSPVIPSIEPTEQPTNEQVPAAMAHANSLSQANEIKKNKARRVANQIYALTGGSGTARWQPYAFKNPATKQKLLDDVNKIIKQSQINRSYIQEALKNKNKTSTNSGSPLRPAGNWNFETRKQFALDLVKNVPLTVGNLGTRNYSQYWKNNQANRAAFNKIYKEKENRARKYLESRRNKEKENRKKFSKNVRGRQYEKFWKEVNALKSKN